MVDFRFLLFTVLVFSFSCTSDEVQVLEEKEIDLSSYVIEPEFELDVLASEPLLIAPVAMDFDKQGRMWVLELPGYMTDIDGKGEHDPTGRIIILQDKNKNGRMDDYKTFLNKLVAPRAMLLAYDGLLYAEPPNLWYVPIENDLPGKKVLVDSSYVQVGNIEHQANGLMMNIDNWIYSARSNARYQRKNGKWIKEQTAYRGQWGLTKDYYGRLFYNDNSNQFQGDLVLPMLATNNHYLKPKHSIRQQIATDQRLYPLHAAIINRGYAEGNLDREGKPTKITSSCGPVIYQGEVFPDDYLGNSFVCLPEGNIVKRNIMSYEDTIISAVQAWQEKEFIASTDPAFRPVNLYNGPDGAMYIVDMHKGIIQHRAYMSPYLREKIKELKMDTIVGCGRILRVCHKNSSSNFSNPLDQNSLAGLVDELNNPNVWIRDKVQQSIVQGHMKEAVPHLESFLYQEDFSIGQFHALWALQGLDGLTEDLLGRIINHKNPELKTLAFYLLFELDDIDGEKKMKWAEKLLATSSTQLNLNLIASLGLNLTKDQAYRLYMNLAKTYLHSSLLPELCLSSLSANEKGLLKELIGAEIPNSSHWISRANEVISNRKANNLNQEMLPATDQPYGDKRQKGLELYRMLCSVCHGEDGNGIENLAPPLKGSDYISGDLRRLGLIILHGLQGPIHINGKEFNFNAAMPGIAANDELSDQDILSIMSFVRNAFSTKWMDMGEEELSGLRKLEPPAGQMYTEELLDNALSKPQ